MVSESYVQFETQIATKIFRRNGYRWSEAIDIAQNIIDHVRNAQGSGSLWLHIFSRGNYKVSSWRTLKEFNDALDNISIPTGIFSRWQNRNEFKALIKKFQTQNAIAAINAFTEKFSKKGLVYIRERFVSGLKLPKAAFAHISRDPAQLYSQAKVNYEKWKTSYKVTLQEVKTMMTFYRTPSIFIKTFAGFFGMLNSVITNNEVTIGVLPLGGMGIDSPTSVTMIDVSHSNKIVKYRAVGSIYLAHQVGGHDSIRITGKLQGPMRLWFLTALWVLTILSQGQWKTIDWGADLAEVIGGGIDSIRSVLGDPIPMHTVDNIITQQPAYEKHMTYPIITEHEIIPNCYVETFSFEEKIETGRDIITYDLLLRTYVEPKEFLHDQKRAVMRISKRETNTEQMLKYSANFAYRLLQYGKEQIARIDSSTWKVENYYDLDIFDMAFTMGLGLGGNLLG